MRSRLCVLSDVFLTEQGSEVRNPPALMLTDLHLKTLLSYYCVQTRFVSLSLPKQASFLTPSLMASCWFYLNYHQCLFFAGFLSSTHEATDARRQQWSVLVSRCMLYYIVFISDCVRAASGSSLLFPAGLKPKIHQRRLCVCFSSSLVRKHTLYFRSI